MTVIITVIITAIDKK